MRKPTDICLLCDTNQATKENSHIIPKFIGKSIFGSRGIKRAYLVDTNKGHEPADFTQGTIKESYLFCPNCESYLSNIETYIAERFHKRLRTAKLTDQFPLYENKGGVTWKICLQVNPIIFRLFIYSIVWRCSISESSIHQKFKLSSEEDTLLKSDLKKYITSTYKEFIEKIETRSENIMIFPFVIYTSQSFHDNAMNTIFTSSYNKNPYVLHLNEYIVLFSFKTKTFLDNFDFLVNNDISHIKLGFFSEEFWLLENKRFFDETVKLTIKTAKAAGHKLYVGPE